MAGTIVAYNEITILDLIDTATYIYYSSNSDGAGATSAPTSETKYIGIYNGAPIEGGQPTIPPAGTEWSKYVGDKGEDGVGVTITSTSFEYAISKDGQEPPTTGWQNFIPTLNQGEFLWTKTIVYYSDNTNSGPSYSVSYLGIDGTDTSSYYIETNQEEILRFKNVAGQYTYSPSILTFKIYNYPKQNNSEQLELTNNSFKLEVQTSNGFEEVEKGEILRLGYIAYEEGTEKEELDLNTVYFNISSFYAISNQQVENNQNFRFSYLVDNSVASIKIIQMRNGVSEDMAKLNLHASGIDASIQSNRLKFSAEGLSMYKVQDSENGPQITEVFGFDNDGDLYLKGRLDAATGTFRGELEAATGTFEGELKAATGSFSGELTAETGKIGGFTISGDSLYAGENIENSPLVLKAGNGTNSEIIADNITLGVGAKIKDRLIFSEEFYSEENGALKSREAYINNPNLHNGIFIEAGRTLLTSEGFLRLGEIEAFGGDEKQNSYIKAGNINDSSFWEINGDGSANFKEIIVDKATIKNSVLEIGSVQAVGSLMLFKDSWKIVDKKERENGAVYTLETQNTDSEGNYLINLTAGDYVLCNNSGPLQIIEVNHNEIVLSSRSLYINDVVVKIGKNNDFLISILGDSTGVTDYSTKNSLTLSQFTCNETSTGFKNVLVLGDLTGINENYGTGLFAENVFLKGSLITEVEESSYAGINTLNGARATIFEEKGISSEEGYDTSKIVIWAGAKNNREVDIQEAAFQVTEKGSIYAYQGVFEGSLITDSVIKGASIHTAKIYGEDKGEDAALKIYDASKGIQFIELRGQEKEYVTLGINNQGIYTEENKQIISITKESNEAKIKIISDIVQVEKENLGTFIEPGNINFNIGNNVYFQGVNDNGDLTFGKVDNNSKADFFILSQSEVTSPSTFSAKRDVVFGTKEISGSLHYQVIENKGYDLYVS